eukprot:COSAG02_NODE_42_length_46522_cov_109.704478_15_plen_94_part_00
MHLVHWGEGRTARGDIHNCAGFPSHSSTSTGHSTWCEDFSAVEYVEVYSTRLQTAVIERSRRAVDSERYKEQLLLSASAVRHPAMAATPPSLS